MQYRRHLAKKQVKNCLRLDWSIDWIEWRSREVQEHSASGTNARSSYANLEESLYANVNIVADRLEDWSIRQRRVLEPSGALRWEELLRSRYREKSVQLPTTTLSRASLRHPSGQFIQTLPLQHQTHFRRCLHLVVFSLSLILEKNSLEKIQRKVDFINKAKYLILLLCLCINFASSYELIH